MAHRMTLVDDYLPARPYPLLDPSFDVQPPLYDHTPFANSSSPSCNYGIWLNVPADSLLAPVPLRAYSIAQLPPHHPPSHIDSFPLHAAAPPTDPVPFYVDPYIHNFPHRPNGATAGFHDLLNIARRIVLEDLSGRLLSC